MKFKTVFKTVMFYGNVIYLNEEYNWLAVDEDGEIKAFMENHSLAMAFGIRIAWGSVLFLPLWNLKDTTGKTPLPTARKTKDG